MTVRSKDILRKIGEPKLELLRISGHGYWLFIYDDVSAKVYETESVYCVRLNDMTTDQWVDAGRGFLSRVKARLAA